MTSQGRALLEEAHDDGEPVDIGLALLGLADSVEHVKGALDRLGLADAATPMGAIETIGVELRALHAAIGEAGGAIAGALADHD